MRAKRTSGARLAQAFQRDGPSDLPGPPIDLVYSGIVDVRSQSPEYAPSKITRFNVECSSEVA